MNTQTDIKVAVEYKGTKIPRSEHLSPNMCERISQGLYEGPEIAAGLATITEDDRVLEIGTGIGVVASIIAKNAKPQAMLCFEANPYLQPTIRETFELNQLMHVEPRHGVLAVNAQVGAQAEFYVAGNFLGSSVHDRGERTKEKIKVPVHDFDRVLKEFSPTVLMMDIEGAELDLLSDANLHGFRRITFESHPNIYGKDGLYKIYDVLAKKGFRYDAANSMGAVLSFAGPDEDVKSIMGGLTPVDIERRKEVLPIIAADLLLPTSSYLPEKVHQRIREGTYLGRLGQVAISTLHSDDRVLELGAGFGATTVLLNKIVKLSAYLAVEANPDLAALLSQMTEQNGLITTDIRAMTVVAGSFNDDKAIFHISRNHTRSRLVPDTGREKATVQCDAISLARLISDFKPTALICDGPGAEPDAFEAADLSGVSLVILRAVNDLYSENELNRILDVFQAHGLVRHPKLSNPAVQVFTTAERAGPATEEKKTPPQQKPKIPDLLILSESPKPRSDGHQILSVRRANAPDATNLEISFPTFSHELDRFRPAMSEMNLALDLSVQSVRNAIIVPGDGISAQTGRAPLGAYHPDGAYIPEAACLRASYMAPALSVDHLSEIPAERAKPSVNAPAGIYGGHLFPRHQYGHNLVETLSRAWFYNDMPDLPIYVTAHDRDVFDWFTTYFSALDLDFSRFRLIDETTQIDELIIPSQGYILRNGGNADHVQALRGLLPPDLQSNGKSGSLYLSRAKFVARGRRPILGELFLENILRENGVSILHPENHSFEEVMKAHADHDRIFGFMGSAFHHNIFHEGKTTDYFINSVLFFKGPNYFAHELLAGNTVRATYFEEYMHAGQKGPWQRVLARSFEGPQLIDFQHVLDHCYDTGILGHRVKFTYTRSIRDAIGQEMLDVGRKYIKASKETDVNKAKLNQALEERLAALGL